MKKKYDYNQIKGFDYLHLIQLKGVNSDSD